MLIDNNLIAYEYAKGQFTPHEVTKSGEKEETEYVNKYSSNMGSLPVLMVEEDIVNSEGYGIKSGFYNVMPDEYKDFLLLYQSKKLKAKIPVIKIKTLASNNSKPQKIKKTSAKAYEKRLKKEEKKYYKGENPSKYDYRKAEMQYMKDENAWVIKYCESNFELYGIIKF